MVRMINFQNDWYFSGKYEPGMEKENCLVSGPSKIQGPGEFVLTGGSRGFWVETDGSCGEIRIDVSCEGFRAETVSIWVR
ncbi:MAG TPA: hypothetical protein GXX26_00300 [Clostridiaceae bacterium]|nr:hypothetical protein [Clostridiaceae bacterium]